MVALDKGVEGVDGMRTFLLQYAAYVLLRIRHFSTHRFTELQGLGGEGGNSSKGGDVVSPGALTLARRASQLLAAGYDCYCYYCTRTVCVRIVLIILYSS